MFHQDRPSRANLFVSMHKHVTNIAKSHMSGCEKLGWSSVRVGTPPTQDVKVQTLTTH